MTTIYYFSGTGNSLALAKNLQKSLNDAKIINIAAANPRIADEKDTVGFVFPVYFEDMPLMVKNFVEKLMLKRRVPDVYVFGIATCGCGAGLALHTLRELLKRKGLELSTCFAVNMPDNSVIILNKIPSLGEQRSLLSNSKEKIKQIAEIIRKKEHVGTEDKVRLADRVENIFMTKFLTKIYRVPRRLKVSRSCMHCGTCVKICPSGNIRNGERISWGMLVQIVLLA